jgi:hypothetical protein
LRGRQSECGALRSLRDKKPKGEVWVRGLLDARREAPRQDLDVVAQRLRRGEKPPIEHHRTGEFVKLYATVSRH